MMQVVHIIATLSQVCQSTPGGNCGLPTAHSDTAVHNILGIVFGAIGALSLLMLVLAGLRYIVSDGSPEKTSKAKNAVIYSLVGLTIALIAEAVINFVVNRL